MIAVRNLSVRAGAFGLADVSMEVPEGGYAVLMGKTGSGKTTLLEAICGLREVTSGEIVLGGRDVTFLPPGQRGLGYVPQDRALFSTMTVRDHLAFAPSLRKWTKEEIAGRVSELADLLGIRHLLHRRPKGLSGGESQRVALGRALAARPAVLCMDEPLSALDEEMRDEMMDLLRLLRKHTGVTALHVTHSREEARRLADRVFVIKEGLLRQCTPADLGTPLAEDLR